MMMDSAQWAILTRMPGYTPTLFSKDILEFVMTTESQDPSLTSHLKDGAF